MTENPPKPWAFWGLALNDDEIDTDPMLYAYESETTAHGAQEVDKSYDEEGIVGAVQAYVREDVAEAAVAAARVDQAAMGAAFRDLANEQFNGVVTERDALRRERDALRLVARRAGDVLAWVAEHMPEDEYEDEDLVCIVALNEAVDAAKAAGKGVG